MVGRKALHKLPRLYVPQQYVAGALIDIGKDYSHRLSNVLRMREGECFRVFNGTTGEYLCEVDEVTRRQRSVRARVRELIRPNVTTDIKFTLFFSPIKKSRQKILLEKATELGVHHFVPVISQNTNYNFVPSDWMSVAIAATEQSEQLHVPTISDPISIKTLHQEVKTPLFLCTERSDTSEPLITVLLSTLPQHRELSVLVGPEGGFTGVEVGELSQCQHVIPVSLGNTVLRSETACLYVLSCAAAVSQHVLRDKQ